MLCYSQEGLCASLTTLPSEALQTEALKLFKVMWEWSPGCGMWVPMLSLQSWIPLTAQENCVVTGCPKGCDRKRKSHRVPFMVSFMAGT